MQPGVPYELKNAESIEPVSKVNESKTFPEISLAVNTAPFQPSPKESKPVTLYVPFGTQISCGSSATQISCGSSATPVVIVFPDKSSINQLTSVGQLPGEQYKNTKS